MGASLSKAAHALRAKLTPPVMNQSRLAERLGVSQQAVSSWTKGRALPEPERMAEIERLLGIPMRDWVEPSSVVPADDSSGELGVDDSGEHSAIAVPRTG
jgi:transcriptional regulator with XRE-family HTH domain